MRYKNHTYVLRHHDKFPNEQSMHMHVVHIHKHTRKANRVWMKYLCAEFLCFCVSRGIQLEIIGERNNSAGMIGRSVFYTIIFNKYFRFPIPEVPRHSSLRRQAAKTIRLRIHILNS